MSRGISPSTSGRLIRLLAFGCTSLVWLGAIAPLSAQSTKSESEKKVSSKSAPANPAGPIGQYRSARFYLHTDLTAAEAADLLTRLETMLDLVSSYWGRPPRGIIECYVVKDLAKWPDGSLGGGGDEASGRASIRSGGGVTPTHTLGYGSGKATEIVDARATVFAVADRGTPQHEAVHAYCGQTFGRTGPVWYSEGMAEMGQYWRKNDDKSVQIHEGVLEYLQGTSVKSLNAIINNQEQTGDSWQNYAWRWAVCHMLAINPNYSDRFRPLGLAILTGADTTFESVYGDLANEMQFEYQFFLSHIEQGFRVDLCSFDWKKKFIPLRGTTPLTAKVLANHGWQPTQAIVEPAEQYDYTATGTWQLAKDGPRLSAQGGKDGTGRLEGVILHEFNLGKPFELDERGTLTPPEAGQLWVRCHEAWNALADNKGAITFKIKPKK